MEVNNIASIREALEKISEQFFEGCDGKHYAQLNESAYQRIQAALSAPPRNCDIGTADEQAQRYDKLCEGTECVKCPVHALWHHYFEICKNGRVSCGLMWAQMPYEATKGYV